MRVMSIKRRQREQLLKVLLFEKVEEEEGQFPTFKETEEEFTISLDCCDFSKNVITTGDDMYTLEWRDDSICVVCQSPDDEANMVLCDNNKCNNGQHLQCMTPPLTNVPENDWYCNTTCKNMSDFDDPNIAPPTPQPASQPRRLSLRNRGLIDE